VQASLLVNLRKAGEHPTRAGDAVQEDSRHARATAYAPREARTGTGSRT